MGQAEKAEIYQSVLSPFSSLPLILSTQLIHFSLVVQKRIFVEFEMGRIQN